ncbi:uncharacterized protein isoform X1 [Leptinotarsa decemlineata]|uniref:uncharacterized protein isoform X1 n=1 Tax=Leptinotarsa decemlineata TaxID=7539 RepID=UPI003D307F01
MCCDMEYNLLSVTFFMAITTACVFAAGDLNDPCQLVEQCNNFGNYHGYYCGQNRTCQCMMNYVPNKHRDKCVGIIDQRCVYDEHCIEGAFCLNQNSCKCKYNLEPSPDKRSCSRKFPEIDSTTNGFPTCNHDIFLEISPLVSVNICSFSRKECEEKNEIVDDAVSEKTQKKKTMCTNFSRYSGR